VSVSRFLSPARDAASLLWWREDDRDHYRLQPPAGVAARLSQRFPFDDKTGQYFTLVYGLLDLHTHTLRYVSAGHPGVIHVPLEGPAHRIEVTGYPIGVAEEPYDEHEIELAPGDRLYVYSDGGPEAMDAGDTPVRCGRLPAALDRTRGGALDP